MAEDPFRKMTACCLLYLSLGHHLPFQRCFPQMNHSNILQNYTMLQSPGFQAPAVFYVSSLAHLSAGVFILFNLTHLWVSPGTTAPALCLANALRNLPQLSRCAEDSQPGSALLPKFTSFQLPPCTPLCFGRPPYPHPSLKVLQEERCERRANVLKADLSARLNSSPLRQCWGRGNSIRHAWAPDEAGCPQQCAFQHGLLACRTSHAGCASAWSRTSSP